MEENGAVQGPWQACNYSLIVSPAMHPKKDIVGDEQFVKNCVFRQAITRWGLLSMAQIVLQGGFFTGSVQKVLNISW